MSVVLLTRTVQWMVLIAALLAAPAAAQIVSLPPALVSKVSEFTPAEIEQVSTFAIPHLQALGGDDPAARSRARAALADPARLPNASVAFRQVYSTRLLPRLRELVQGDEPAKVIAALDVAGAIGSIEGWQLIAPKLNDERLGVRLAASVASRSTLQSVSPRASALNPATANAIIDAVAARLVIEPDVQIADSLSRTLLQGGQLVGIAGYEAAGRSAWTKLAAGIGDNMFASREDTGHNGIQTRLTVLGALEQLRTRTGLAQPVGTVDPAIVRAGASIAGETLAMVATNAQLAGGEPLSEEQIRMSRMATAVLALVATQSNQPAPDAALNTPPADPAGYANFFRDARTYVLTLAQRNQVEADRLRRWFP